jgi:hypothetical protein
VRDVLCPRLQGQEMGSVRRSSGARRSSTCSTSSQSPRCRNETVIEAVSSKGMNSKTSGETPWGLLCDVFGVRRDIEDIMRVVGDSIHGPHDLSLRDIRTVAGSGTSHVKLGRCFLTYEKSDGGAPRCPEGLTKKQVGLERKSTRAAI